MDYLVDNRLVSFEWSRGKRRSPKIIDALRSPRSRDLKPGGDEDLDISITPR